MERVTSKDGTAIAFERVGTGSALVLVSGATGLPIGRLAVCEVPYAWPYAVTDDGPLVSR